MREYFSLDIAALDVTATMLEVRSKNIALLWELNSIFV